MPQPFYHYDEDHDGSHIMILVERNTGEHDFGNGDVVTLHHITAEIDGIDTGISIDNPTDAHPPVYDSISNVLTNILTGLRADIDEEDELDSIMLALGYIGGSESIEGFSANPAAVTMVQTAWTIDADITNLEIESDTVDTFATATLEASGAITPPQTYGPYTSGATMYFRIRGQRTGEDFGPWAYSSVIVP